MWEGGSVVQGLDDHCRRGRGTHHPHPPLCDRHTVCEEEKRALYSRKVRFWRRVSTKTQNITFYHTYTLCFIWILEVYSFNLHITYEIKMSSGLFKPCVSLCCMYSDRETLVQDRSYDHIDQYHRKPSFKVEDRRIQTVNK